MIPNFDFITSLFNIKKEDVAFFDTSIIDDSVFFDITLVRKTLNCPFCNSPMVGFVHKQKLISHPALRFYSSTIKYRRVHKFETCNIRQYAEFTNILKNWKSEILNSFMKPNRYRLSNALTKNINGKISQYITLSKGVRNSERYRKKILFALNPDVS